MKTSFSSLILVLIPMALLLLASCQVENQYPDDQWWTVASGPQPLPLTQYGVHWIACQQSDGSWKYYPRPVLDFMREMKVDNGGHIDAATLQLAGRTWKFTADKDGKWSAIPPWEDSIWSDWKVICIIVLSVVLFFALIAWGLAHESGFEAGVKSSVATAKESAEAEIAKVRQAEEKALKEQQNELAKQLVTTERVRKKIQQEWQQEDTRLKTREAENEEIHRRKMTAVENAQAMLRAGGDKSGAVGKYLREQQLKRAGFGDHISAVILVDRTGFVQMAWTVQLDRTRAPMVIVARDKNVIHTTCGFIGDQPDHLVPGQRHLYSFGLRDEQGREIGRPAMIEVKVPTSRWWDDRQSSDREEELRTKFKTRYGGMKIVEQLKQTAYAEIKAEVHDEDMREWLLGQIDALAQELLGETG